MSDSDRKNGRNSDGQFTAGNAGKPTGARHKTTLAIEAMLDGEGEKLTRKAIDLALSGDTTALRLCIERVAPLRKGRSVAFDLPSVEAARDVSIALGAVVRAVSEGVLTPDEALSIASLLEMKRRAIETIEIESRLTALEERRHE